MENLSNLTPEELHVIESDMQSAKQTLAKIEKFAMDRSDDSIYYLDGLLERQRRTPSSDGGGAVIYMIGLLLGQCICNNFNGTWKQDQHRELYVELPDGLIMSPHSKVLKQFENGGPLDSIYDYYLATKELCKPNSNLKLMKSPVSENSLNGLGLVSQEAKARKRRRKRRYKRF